MSQNTAESGCLSPNRAVYELASVSAPMISRDGSRLAFTKSMISASTGLASGELWMMDPDGANQHRISTSGSVLPGVAWANDDSAIAFVSKHDDRFTICVLTLATEVIREITTYVNAPKELSWSPDGSHIAYVVSVDPDNPDEANEAEDSPVARVIRRIDYKQDGRGILNDVRHQVVVLDLVSGERRQVSIRLNDHVSPLWSPDGTAVAVKVATQNGMNSHLEILPIGGAAATLVGWESGTLGVWNWTPDGRSILFDGYPRSSPQTDFFRYDLETGAVTQLTDNLDFVPEVGYPTVSGPAKPIWIDETTALVHGARAGRSGLWTINAATGELSEMAYWNASHAGLSADASCNLIAQSRSDFRGPGKIVVFSRETGETNVILDVNEDFFAQNPPAIVEQIKIDRGDWMIDAWLHKPWDFDENRVYPLVIDIHGGPHGAHASTFAITPQILASNDILVVTSNPRGSSTYGREFGEAVIQDWGGEDWIDIQTVVDTLIERPYIDQDRTGIYGYSYGGYMTSWAIGQTDRFKAAVCGAPAFNLHSMYGTSDISHVFGEVQWGGGLQDAWDWMIERSPSSYIHKAVTPTLILHGESDDRCPIGQAEELFVGLKKADCETELVRYPGGSHLMHWIGPAKLRADFNSRILQWFKAHLGDPQ